jgi:hypothetical protein
MEIRILPNILETWAVMMCDRRSVLLGMEAANLHKPLSFCPVYTEKVWGEIPSISIELFPRHQIIITKLLMFPLNLTTPPLVFWCSTYLLLIF